MFRFCIGVFLWGVKMNKKIGLIIPVRVEATRGCCSHHGGVSGCSSSGRQFGKIYEYLIGKNIISMYKLNCLP